MRDKEIIFIYLIIGFVVVVVVAIILLLYTLCFF